MAARKLRWRKDGVTNLSTEDATWQWLLDHTRWIDSERFFVGTFKVKSKEFFLKSLQVRKDGKYRHSEEELLTKLK